MDLSESDFSSRETDSKKMSSTQLRKIKKPIIEKRRRERINESLNQLKNLVLEALQKDENQYNKMEKADILELTVRYLKNLQRQNGSLSALHCPERDFAQLGLPDVQWTDNFREGFRGCADEVLKYLNGTGLTPEVRERLNGHLRTKMDGLHTSQEQTNNNNNNLNLTQGTTCYRIMTPEGSLVAAPGSLSQPAPVIQTLPVLQPVTLLNGQTIYVAASTLPALSPLNPVQPAAALGQTCGRISPVPLMQARQPNANDVSATYKHFASTSPPPSSESLSSDELMRGTISDISPTLDKNGNKLTFAQFSKHSNQQQTSASRHNVIPIRPKPVVTETVTSPTFPSNVRSIKQGHSPLSDVSVNQNMFQNSNSHQRLQKELTGTTLERSTDISNAYSPLGVDTNFSEYSRHQVRSQTVTGRRSKSSYDALLASHSPNSILWKPYQ